MLQCALQNWNLQFLLQVKTRNCLLVHILDRSEGHEFGAKKKKRWSIGRTLSVMRIAPALSRLIVFSQKWPVHKQIWVVILVFGQGRVTRMWIKSSALVWTLAAGSELRDLLLFSLSPHNIFHIWSLINGNPWIWSCRVGRNELRQIAPVHDQPLTHSESRAAVSNWKKIALFSCVQSDICLHSYV